MGDGGRSRGNYSKVEEVKRDCNKLVVLAALRAVVVRFLVLEVVLVTVSFDVVRFRMNRVEKGREE